MGTITACPRPEKQQLTQAEAEAHARNAKHYLNPDIRAYQCVCGHWHVGKNKAAFVNRVRGVVGSGNHKRHKESQRNQKRRKR